MSAGGDDVEEHTAAEGEVDVEVPPVPTAFGLALMLPIMAVFAWFLIQFWTSPRRRGVSEEDEEE